MTFKGLNLADSRLDVKKYYDLELSLSESGQLVNILYDNNMLYSIDPLKDQSTHNLFEKWEIVKKKEFIKELVSFIKRKE